MHRLQIRPIVHNLREPPAIPPTYVWFCAVVWECGEGQANTDIQMAVTNTHFALATMPHAKCNKLSVSCKKFILLIVSPAFSMPQFWSCIF